LAGALFVPQVGIISPAEMGIVPSVEMVIWVAIGGRGTLVGSVIGAILVNSLKSMVSESFPAVWSYFIGISFIAVVIFMPYGLAGLLNQIKGKIYAQKAQKSVKRYSSATLNILEESGCDEYVG